MMDEIVARIEQAVQKAGSFEQACARVVSLLRREIPRFNWVGIYLKEGEELILGPWDEPRGRFYPPVWGNSLILTSGCGQLDVFPRSIENGSKRGR